MINRQLSRLKTRVGRWLGRTARRVSGKHPQIVSRWRIQEAGQVDLANALESRVLGRPIVTRISYPEAFLYELRDIWLTGKHGYPFLEADAVLSCCPSMVTEADGRLQRPVRAFAQHVRDPVFHLTGPNAGNRAHFLVEHLPRLMASLSHLAGVDAYRLLLIPARSGWQRPLLTRLGIGAERLLEGSKGTLRCDRVFYAPLLCADRRFPLVQPEVYLGIKRMVEAHLPTPPPGPTEMFLSRRDAPDRQLRNEEAVVACLRRRWPRLATVRLTGMPLDDQLALFRNARLVVGPQGQGFHNVLFCNRSLIIQLTSGTRDEAGGGNWCEIFSALAMIAGNSAVTLHSGIACQRRADWDYPLEHMEAQMAAVERAAQELGAWDRRSATKRG